MARFRVGSSRVRWWLAAPLLAAIVLAVPVPAWVVEEFYSRDAYPWLQRGITQMSNLVPFAVLDGLIAGAVVLVAYRLVRLVIVARREGLFDAMSEGLRRMLRATAVVLLAFMTLWGCNYRRVSLDPIGDAGAAQTLAGLRQAIADAGRVAGQLRDRHDLPLELSYEEVAAALRAPMNQALETLDRVPLAEAGRPKSSVLLDPFFEAAGVSGMVNPLGLESIVQADLLPVERPAVLAHEWAHLAGHADEAEASAVGWLACMKGEPALAYSASLWLIMQAGSLLPAGEWQQAANGLHPAVRQDVTAIIRRTIDQQQPTVHRAATRVYDEYLRANQVADGTASYGRALTLVLSPGYRQALEQYTPPERTGPAPR